MAHLDPQWKFAEASISREASAPIGQRRCIACAKRMSGLQGGVQQLSPEQQLQRQASAAKATDFMRSSPTKKNSHKPRQVKEEVSDERKPGVPSMADLGLKKKKRPTPLSAAAEAEVAEVATPFDRRVRVALVERLGERTPALLATGRAVELATAAVELALSDYFDARQMNASVEYLLDRHRLSRRLQKMPPSALELFLRKKEQIMGALLEMDADGDGDISLDEFEQGLANLRLELSPADARAIFDVLDADGGGSLQPAELETLIFGRELKEAERADMREGANREQGHGETPPVATPGKEKRSLGRTARSKRTTVAPCRATRPPHAPDAHPIARRAAPWSVWA